MIDTDLITRYTNALYKAQEPDIPRYNEFRDMFSEGQLFSKFWLIEQLEKLVPLERQKIIIVGAWFGTLAFLLKKKSAHLQITCMDSDPRCEQYIKALNTDNPITDVFATSQDMNEYVYTEDIIINSSCEHIASVSNWLEKLPKNSLVVLQSNNYAEGEGHINCSLSVEDFVKQTEGRLSRIYYTGQLPLTIYQRYMIIGKT